LHSFEITNSIKGQVYYHSAHSWNIPAIADVTRKALAHLQPVLGEYPYLTLQIAEIPYYNDEFYTSHSLIAIPEKHGWTADLKRKNDEAYIAYIMVREIARQMIGQQVRVANVQGAGIFQYALPDYYAIQYVRQKYGAQSYKDLLQRKINDYKKERGSEANEEPALVNTDGAEYVERDKGAVVFCRLKEQAGTLDGLLKNYLEKAVQEDKAVTGRGLVAYLKNQLPATVQEQIKRDFEEVNPLD